MAKLKVRKAFRTLNYDGMDWAHLQAIYNALATARNKIVEQVRAETDGSERKLWLQGKMDAVTAIMLSIGRDDSPTADDQGQDLLDCLVDKGRVR